MKAIVRTCWQICLLRQGPQVFPQSTALLVIMAVLYALLDAVLFALGGSPLGVLVESVVADIAMLVIFCVIVLSIWHHLSRLNQTLIALFGASSVIMVLQVPLVWIEQWKGPWHFLTVGVGFVLILFIFWNIAVIGHILRHALSIASHLALLLAGVYAVINIAFFYWAFPVS